MAVEQDTVSIILVHGGALSGSMYKDMEPILSAQGYRVICPDLPGHGDSIHLGPFSFPASTDYLHSQAKKARDDLPNGKVVLVGVSLGGQAVLHFLSQHPALVDAAVVSGATIQPPSDDVGWEMPHMPDSGEWMSLIMADVGKLPPGAAEDIQKESLGFSLEVHDKCPPVLLVIGEHDVAMARRDFGGLYDRLHRASPKTEKMVLGGAWHNHPIDVPERFSTLISDWAMRIL